LIVVDASILANAIGDDGTDGRAARSELRAHAGALAAPDLVDVETVAVLPAADDLRSVWLAGRDSRAILLEDNAVQRVHSGARRSQ
jgi:hypothetical protein